MAYIKIILICAGAIGLGILFGSAAVYFFNKMPGEWLVDYGETPSKELKTPTVQRVKSTPYKYIFTGFFIVTGIFVGLKDPLYALPTLISLWLLLEMAIADIKYMIIPDQLILMLVVCGFGFIPYQALGVKGMIFGGLTGFGVLIILALISKLIYKKSQIGGADIKLFATLGLLTGIDGLIVIFILTTFLSAGHFVYLLARRKITLKSQHPMVPYIALGTFIYLVFLHDKLYDFIIMI